MKLLVCFLLKSLVKLEVNVKWRQATKSLIIMRLLHKKSLLACDALREFSVFLFCYCDGFLRSDLNMC